MGCISSRIAERSSSFREEINHTLQRSINGWPMLEDLLISKNGGDQFVTLVCTANKVSEKVQAGTLPLESNTDVHTSVEQINRETINAGDLKAGLEEQPQQGQQQQTLHQGCQNHMTLSSTSIHKSEEHTLVTELECSLQSNKCGTVMKNATTGDSTGLTCSRSFHTVEEYDALVGARHRRSEVFSNLFDFKNLVLKNTEVSESSSSSYTMETVSINKDVTEKEHYAVQKKLRRNARAKQLSTLSIPTTTVKFSATGSFGDWIELGDQGISFSDYDTPKFGNFNGPTPSNGNGSCAVFDPDMVTEFEEAMKKLTVEEECILKQIIEDMDEEGEVDKADKEDFPNTIHK